MLRGEDRPGPGLAMEEVEARDESREKKGEAGEYRDKDAGLKP